MMSGNRRWVVSGLLALTLGLSPVWAETRHLASVSYNASAGELTLTAQDGTALETENVLHHPRRRELVFDLPGVVTGPDFEDYLIQNDPVIKSVSVAPIKVKGQPPSASRVKIKLWTNAPFLPFMMVPSQPGLKLLFTRPNEAEVKPAGAAATSSTVQNTHFIANTHLDKPAETVKPLTNPAESVLGQVSEDVFSVIQDVFYDENALTIVSKSHPIEVKRSFVLTEPNRYIVDISPAVLESRSLMRAIPQSNPDVVSMKTGQFDETTVRIVVHFADKVKPVDISQWEGNKVLKLTF